MPHVFCKITKFTETVSSIHGTKVFFYDFGSIGKNEKLSHNIIPHVVQDHDENS